MSECLQVFWQAIAVVAMIVVGNIKYVIICMKNKIKAQGNCNVISLLYIALPAPTNVRPGAVTHVSAEITWDRSTGATGYVISYTATSGQTVTVNVGDTTSHTLTDLVENTPYDITVQGRTSDGRQSDTSTVLSITTTAGK